MVGGIKKSGLVWLMAAALFASFAAPIAATPPPLSVYGRLPGFERAVISPSGNHLAILGTVNGKRVVLIQDATLKLVQVFPLGNVKVRSIDWAGDMAVLIRYSATVDLGMGFTTNKAELSTVTVAPLDGSPPWQVFKEIESITGGVRGQYGVVEHDGRWYGYFGGFTMVRNTASGYLTLADGRLNADLYEVDLQTHKARLVAKAPEGNNTDRQWMINDKGEVGAEMDIASQSGRWTLRDALGRVLATDTDPLGRVYLVGFSPDGLGAIYSQRQDGIDQHQWYTVPLAGGSGPQRYLENADIDEYFLDEGNRLIGYRSDESGRASHFFNPRQDKIYKATERAFPNLHISLVDHSTSFERLIIKTEGPGDPGTWWLVDIKSGKADIIGASYAIKGADVGPMRMVPFTASDGLKMEGVLTLPPGREAKSLPAVILPHGGPQAHDDAGFDWIAQALASRGYAVFQPNFRGSTGYGNTFVTAGNGEWGRKMQTDISDGLAALVKQGTVDPQRVCILGASYGGYAALAGVTIQQGIYRCAVSIAGISDLAKMVHADADRTNADPMLMRNLKKMVGSGSDLKAVSPINFISKVSVPVLLIHGKDDTVVDYAQSKIMADALSHAGKTVEFVTLPHEDHWLSSGDTRQAMLEASVSFVIKHNPPDPAK